MTEEQKENYLAVGGVVCIYCEEYDIELVHCESSDCGATFNTIKCNGCGKQWRNVLDLCDVLPNED